MKSLSCNALIGHKVYQDEFMYVPIDNYGMVGLFGESGHGKTQLAKILISEISMRTDRCILIIDPIGTDYEKLVYPNYKASNPFSLNKHRIINNMCIKMTDLKDTSDWTGIGFSFGAAKFVSSIVNNIKCHNNDPEIVMTIIDNAPTKSKDIDTANDILMTNSIYNFRFIREVSSEMKKAAAVYFHMVKGIFWNPDPEIEYRVLIDDWAKELLEHRVVIVNFTINGSTESFKGQAYLGAILKNILPKLYKLNPMIVIDEAGYFIPKMKTNDNLSNSAKYLLEIVFRWGRRTKTMILFISQDDILIHDDILRGMHWMILGKMAFDSKLYKRHPLHLLRFNMSKGYREFMLISRNGRETIFTPKEVPCLP